MELSFWQKRLSERRLLGGATGVAIAGASAGLLLPRRGLVRASSAQNPFVLAEDIRHYANEFASGDLQGLAWSSSSGQTVMRAASSSGGIYTSPIVQTSFPATHIGLHWLADAPAYDQIRFELRTSSDGWTWSPWKTLYIEAEPNENPRHERFASLVSAAGTTQVQYRAFFPQNTPDATALRNVTVTVLAAAPPEAPLEILRTSTKTPTPKSTSSAPSPQRTPAASTRLSPKTFSSAARPGAHPRAIATTPAATKSGRECTCRPRS